MKVVRIISHVVFSEQDTSDSISNSSIPPGVTAMRPSSPRLLRWFLIISIPCVLFIVLLRFAGICYQNFGDISHYNEGTVVVVQTLSNEVESSYFSNRFIIEWSTEHGEWKLEYNRRLRTLCIRFDSKIVARNAAKSAAKTLSSQKEGRALLMNCSFNPAAHYL